MSSTAEAIDLISSEESDTEEEETTASPAIDLTDTLDKVEDDQVCSVLEAADTAERMVKTYKERQASQKRIKAKNNPWPTPKSRKKSRQARRAPVKDSKRFYHAKTMQTLFIQAFLRIPGVREALQQLRATREEESKESIPQQEKYVGDVDESEGSLIVEAWSADEGPKDLSSDQATEVEAEQETEQDTQEIGDDDRPAVEWPTNITRSLQLNIKEGVKLKHNWPADQCNCYGDCYPDICPNAAGDLFCARDNCKYRGRCSNGVYETHDMELLESHTGIGVRATGTIPVGTSIAPYTGFLTDFDYDYSDTQHEYVIELQTKGRGNKKLYIDAEEWGTVARFVNHSCEPNTRFVEKRHNREVHFMVTTLKEIVAGEEITVDYEKTWFTHACKTKNCRQKLSESAYNRQETTG